MLMAAVAMLASCSKDLTFDLGPNLDEQQSVQTANGGIVLELSMDDFTRVTVEGDNVAKTSKLRWEVGDEVTVVYEGASYLYVATAEGRTTNFAAKDEANAFLPTDMNKPVAVFYNVTSIDAAAMTATFDVAAEQVVGEASNKLPLYSYNATVVVEDGKLVAIMKPLASVVEFELKASKSWNIDAVSIESSMMANTYAVASGVVVDAATGALNLENAVVGDAVMVKLGAAVNLSTAQNVQAVVMGVSDEVTTTTKVEDQDVTTTTYTSPLYHGKAVLKLYKNGHENARRTIWATYTPAENGVNERKHIYQPVSDVLKDKVADGISTAEQMKAFADAINGTTERYPAGAEFSNEDGVIVLKNNIDLSAYSNWIAIGCNNTLAQDVKPQFTGIFDGNGNTISGLKINQNVNEYKLKLLQATGEVVDCVQNSAGLFGVVAKEAIIRNLTVEGSLVMAMADPVDGGFNWSYAGGIVGQINGGQIINCTNKVAISCGDEGCGKVRVGGIVGRAYPSTADILIKNCTNEMALNFEYATPKSQQAVIGGLIGFHGDGSKGYIADVDNCHNKGNVAAFNIGDSSYVGGAIGYCNVDTETAGVISDSTNIGSVKAGTTYESCSILYIGGFAGRQNSHKCLNCTNSGAVSVDTRNNASNQVAIGGFVGIIHGGANKVAYATNCHNTGAVTASGMAGVSNLMAAGFVGYPRYCCELLNCTNSGDVVADILAHNASNWSGGFAGKVGVAADGHENGIIMKGCKNSGTFTISPSATTTGWSYGGGFAGCCYGGTNLASTGSYGIHLIECENTGLVRLVAGFKTRLGGLSGLNNSSYFLNCKNSGTVAVERVAATGADYVGGIAGQIEDTVAVVEGCVNTGTICSFYMTGRESGTTTSNIYILLGGIAGNGGGTKSVIKNCINTGNLLASHDTNNDWDDTKGNWSVGNGVSKNYQYRSAIIGNPNKALRVENCQVGGAVGAVKGGDGADKYEPSVLHKLTNIEGDTYYYARWAHGYTKPVYTALSFYTE